MLEVQVELECAKAESLRKSSSANSERFNCEGFGPGEVLGRRTLLSHPRDGGVLSVLVVCVELVVEVLDIWTDKPWPLVSAATAASVAVAVAAGGASSSLMALDDCC